MLMEEVDIWDHIEKEKTTPINPMKLVSYNKEVKEK
jgi:hypothetical protein